MPRSIAGRGGGGVESPPFPLPRLQNLSMECLLYRHSIRRGSLAAALLEEVEKVKNHLLWPFQGCRGSPNRTSAMHFQVYI